MNEQLEYWSYPLMCIDRIFSKLNGSKLFSTLDVRSGYYNITIAEDSRQYTAFTTEYGKYEFLRIPSGIYVVPSYFALMINETLKGLDFFFTYLDDIIIYSKTEQQHLDHIRQVFNQTCTVNIKLKRTRYDFFKSQIHYLRQLLSKDSVSPLLKKN